MARLPVGRRAANRRAANNPANTQAKNPANNPANHRPAVNLEELTRNATYIVDKAGQRKAIVVEWSAWENFVRQAGQSTAPATSSAAPAAPKSSDKTDSEYALHRSGAGRDLYRPKPASDKEAADFKLESNVTRRSE